MALVGAGSIGREHGLLLMKHPETQLVGIADTSSEARTFAKERNVPFFQNYEQMLDDLQPDGAIIALPCRPQGRRRPRSRRGERRSEMGRYGAAQGRAGRRLMPADLFP
jgi:hypothetical protein